MGNDTAFNSVADLYERFADFWEEVDSTVHDWVQSALTFSTQRGGEPVRGLDIGCGTGRYTSLLTPYCTSVLGVDPSANMLAIARRDRPGDKVTYMQRTILDLRTDIMGMFDYVVSVRALHHAGPADVVLPFVKSLLLPGGRLIVVDMVNPGGWETEEFHHDRARRMASAAVTAANSTAAAGITTDLLLHPSWLASVVTDIPLTRDEFESTYQRYFPGCVMYDFNETTGGMIWDAPRIDVANRPARHEML
jgi:SAM-dependent methyltransferase